MKTFKRNFSISLVVPHLYGDRTFRTIDYSYHGLFVRCIGHSYTVYEVLCHDSRHGTPTRCTFPKMTTLLIL